LQQRLAHKPAWGWLDHFHIAELGQQQVTLCPTPGQRGMLSLINDARKQELTQHLSELLRRSVKVQVQPPSESSPDAAGSPAASQPSPAGQSESASLRQQAMALPLVREVFEQFPNASLTHVERRQTPTDEPTPSEDAGPTEPAPPPDEPEQGD
jgi:hypothetical protein